MKDNFPCLFVLGGLHIILTGIIYMGEATNESFGFGLARDILGGVSYRCAPPKMELMTFTSKNILFLKTIVLKRLPS